MEITHINFQKLCPLLREGYSVNGRNDNGIILLNTNRTKQGAKNDLNSVCKRCGCNTQGNCQPEVETESEYGEIYARIE